MYNSNLLDVTNLKTFFKFICVLSSANNNSKQESVSIANENIKPNLLQVQVIPEKKPEKEVKQEEEVKQNEVNKVNKLDPDRVTGMDAEFKKLFNIEPPTNPKPKPKSYNPNDVHGEKTDGERKENFNKLKEIAHKVIKSRQPNSSSKDNSQVNKLNMNEYKIKSYFIEFN